MSPVKEIKVNIIPIDRSSEKYQEIVQTLAEGVKTSLPRLVKLKEKPEPPTAA